MADNSVPDLKPGLNPDTALFDNNNHTVEYSKERLFLLLTQLDALVQVAVQGDLTQHSEAVLYHYLTVIGEQVTQLKIMCEWLVSRAFPASVHASTGSKA